MRCGLLLVSLLTLSGSWPLRAAPSSILLEAERRLKQADPAAAAVLYAEAAEQEGLSQAGMEARYRRAQALALVPGRAVEAVHAFRQFLALDSERAPPRLRVVALEELARLLSLSAHSAEWEALERLRLSLQAYPYPERVARLEALIEASSGPEVRRAAFQMRVEEAWFARDWTGVTRSLERQASALGPLSSAWRSVRRQAEVELRRIFLAWVTGVGILLAGVAAGWRFWQLRGQGGGASLQLRPLGRLILHWWATLALLYGFYWLGKRMGDVGPVVAQRMGVLGLLTTLGLTLSWILKLPPPSGLRARLVEGARAWRLSGARALLIWDASIGLLIHACMIYLFCYLYDYASVLGL